MDGISRDNQSNYNYPVGVGYITIPTGVDRELYIATCYRKERVAIQLDGGGGVVNNCYISTSALQRVKFPDYPDEIGSCVVFISPKFNNIPIITEVVSKEDETQLLEENSFKKIVETATANVSIEGKGKSGELFINVESDFEGEGSIYITLKSKNNTAKFNLNCFGDVNIYSEGKTALKALKDINLQKIRIEDNEEIISSEVILSDSGFELKDSTGNIIRSDTEGGIINIYPTEKCNLFEGDEPIPKGNTLKIELEKLQTRFNTFLDTYSNTPVTPADGGLVVQTAVKAAMLTVGKEDFENINSLKSFTD